MNLVAAMALASFVSAPVPKDTVRDAQAAIQGEWKVIQCSVDGEQRPLKGVEGNSFTATIKGSELTLYPAEGGTIRGTFAVDPRSTPSTIDFESTETHTFSVQGIYRHEGQKLTICFGMGGEGRPKVFTSEKGGKTSFLTLERAKK